jgi:signal transduction histidine kinase
MIVSLSTQDVKEGKESLSNTVLILQVVLTLMILAAAYYTSRILTKPFGKITQSLEEVQAGVGENEISIPDYTETKLLSEAYNRMLNRMKRQEESRQEFVSNVSHELKTPLTSMKVLADSLLAQEDVPVELYKEFMGDIAEEIDRENKIITDLLSLVKLDKTSADINIQETNINQLIELILKRLRPIAAKRNIELVLESFKPILAEVDETKLTLALSNLVENGIKYNREDGWVHVSLNIDNKYFYVKVEDSGIGIPEADQEHIFERFYRVDKSHSREIGGTGLGLAITRSAVLMHHGAIKVYSKEGEGTTFTVRIPLKYVP